MNNKGAIWNPKRMLLLKVLHLTLLLVAAPERMTKHLTPPHPTDLQVPLVTTSKALVTSSVALVSNSFLLLLVRHLLLVAWHLFLIASCYY